jgi:2-polyprenyl-3-methyl-5-hydroxy-6-metoxy-1,4-benzoquinol methylase
MDMDIDTLRRQKDEMSARYGPWTAHNIHLVENVYTIKGDITGDEFRLRRIMQIIADVAARPFSELRVLDLACLEGMYSVELARRGAAVVAIEGREANLAKARFARTTLGLDAIELIRDDVRNLSREKYGTFDVVLCLGILYHLDAPDVFLFLERIANVCKGFAIIATHTSLAAVERETYKGREYWGSSIPEHAADSTAEQRERALWASLDNPRSFVLTQASLYNALAHVGFTSAYQCRIPPETIYEDPRPSTGLDWATFLAIAGTRTMLVSAPLLNDRPWEDLPESGLPADARGAPPAQGADHGRFIAWAGRRVRRLLNRR